MLTRSQFFLLCRLQHMGATLSLLLLVLTTAVLGITSRLHEIQEEKGAPKEGKRTFPHNFLYSFSALLAYPESQSLSHRTLDSYRESSRTSVGKRNEWWALHAWLGVAWLGQDLPPETWAKKGDSSKPGLCPQETRGKWPLDGHSSSFVV